MRPPLVDRVLLSRPLWRAVTLLALAACALVLLAGCVPAARVVSGDRRGRALRAWVTVAHVVGQGPLTVDGRPARVAGRLRGGAEDLLVLVPLEAEGLTIDAELAPGDSGSPVVDARGRVVGLVVGRRAGAPVLRRWP